MSDVLDRAKAAMHDLRGLTISGKFVIEAIVCIPELVAECERLTEANDALESSCSDMRETIAGLPETFERLAGEIAKWRQKAIEERAQELAQHEISSEGWRSWDDFRQYDPNNANKYTEQAERELMEAMR